MRSDKERMEIFSNGLILCNEDAAKVRLAMIVQKKAAHPDPEQLERALLEVYQLNRLH